MKKSIFGLFKAFLWEKRMAVIAFLGIMAIYYAVFSLYHLEPYYYLYPFMLSFILLTVTGSISFYLYCKKHTIRQKALHSIDIMPPSLYEGTDLTQRDYLMLLERLNEIRKDEVQHLDTKVGELTEYITLWTHQMKTPITAMDLVVQEMDDDKRKELSIQLFEMNRYVDTLLQYLRLDNMNRDFVLQEYNVGDIVKTAVRYYSMTFINKHLSVEIKNLDEKVVTDEKWLLFCIKQILSNALKYTMEGKIEIRMEDKKLLVKDTGMGINPSDIPRIFEMGFTGYNGHKDKRATGIGLYLTKKILDRLGHDIYIDSIPGEGTTVMIDLSNLTNM